MPGAPGLAWHLWLPADIFAVRSRALRDGA